MLTLTFQIGNDRHGLPHEHIVEVVALVKLTPVGTAPAGVAGAFNYHGKWIPVIDPTLLKHQRPAAARWSTRIVIIAPPLAELENRLIGLVAESATEMITDRDDPAPAADPVPELSLSDLLSAEFRTWTAGFVMPPPAPVAAPTSRPRRRPRHYHPEA